LLLTGAEPTSDGAEETLFILSVAAAPLVVSAALELFGAAELSGIAELFGTEGILSTDEVEGTEVTDVSVESVVLGEEFIVLSLAGTELG